MKKLYGTKSVNAAAIVSVCWKGLPPQEKALYHKLAADDKFRYYNEKSEYEGRLKHIKAEMKETRFTNPVAMVPKGPASPEASSLSQPVPRDIAECDMTILPSPQLCGEDLETEVYVSEYSRHSIALVASKLDDASIDFLIKALK